MRRDSSTTLGKVLGALWWLTVCLILTTAGTAAGFVGRSKVLGPGGLIILLHPPPPQEAFHSDVQTFLILGCDSDYKPGSYSDRYYTGEEGAKKSPDLANQANEAARSDMMMIARMDFAKGEITGVSIPRDTWCQLPGEAGHRINAYHAIARPGEANELTKRAVEYLTGVTIDKVIVVNFDSMQKLVNMMGGVWVTVPRPMDYDDNAGQLHIHLKPGFQKLSGYDAMGYVRFRHSKDPKLTETDFQRQQREKDMLLGFKKAAVANWTHLPEILDAGKAALGDSLSNNELLSLAGFARGIGEQKIRMGVLPTKARPHGSVLDLDADRLPVVLAQYNLGDNASRVSQR